MKQEYKYIYDLYIPFEMHPIEQNKLKQWEIQKKKKRERKYIITHTHIYS